MHKKSILSIKSNPDHPHCDHGPSILFETTKEKYYGCSAFRDSKLCPFRLKTNDLIKKNVKVVKNKKAISIKLNDFLLLDKANRFYCNDCKILFTYSNNEEKSNNPCFKSRHNVSSSISEMDLNFPTRFLTAATNNKANAQYLFSEDFLNYLSLTFRNLKVDKIVCIGAPRLHETVISEKRLGKSAISSFLLDIDERLMAFHENSFGIYNMFNNYFLDQHHSDLFSDFIRDRGDSRNILLFCDPPFGGLLEPLCSTLNSLQQIAEEGGYNVKKMLVLPYFLGKKLGQFSNDLKMLDYRVLYANHKRMDKPDNAHCDTSEGNRRESVVRIFTDYGQEEIRPPNDDNYKHCSLCRRFSHKGNVHCKKCNCCPTRHGPTYEHCDKCGKCRQPSKKHCDKCGFCNSVCHICQKK